MGRHREGWKGSHPIAESHAKLARPLLGGGASTGDALSLTLASYPDATAEQGRASCPADLMALLPSGSLCLESHITCKSRVTWYCAGIIPPVPQLNRSKHALLKHVSYRKDKTWY